MAKYWQRQQQQYCLDISIYDVIRLLLSLTDGFMRSKIEKNDDFWHLLLFFEINSILHAFWFHEKKYAAMCDNNFSI